MGVAAPRGPVLFAYDGSDLAALAIGRAAGELAAGRDTVVLCVWQPVDVGFVPTGTRHFDADQAPEVRRAAEETAAHGASLAEKAEFRAPEPGGRGRADLERESLETAVRTPRRL